MTEVSGITMMIHLTIIIDTPLGMACGRNGHVQCIPQIIAGGAHIDFRGSGGLTPIHRAAIGGNALAIKVLKCIMCTLFNTSILLYDILTVHMLFRHCFHVGHHQITWMPKD